MIPSTNNILTVDLKITALPSKNYKMDFDTLHINGYTDNLEAMKQVVYKILMTERYQYVIYSWNYGIELQDLIGERVSFVCPEIERRVTEALIQDDRIEAVDDFKFDTGTKHQVVAHFTVHTIFGDIDAERGVTY